MRAGLVGLDHLPAAQVHGDVVDVAAAPEHQVARQQRGGALRGGEAGGGVRAVELVVGGAVEQVLAGRPPVGVAHQPRAVEAHALVVVQAVRVGAVVVAVGGTGRGAVTTAPAVPDADLRTGRAHGGLGGDRGARGQHTAVGGGSGGVGGSGVGRDGHEGGQTEDRGPQKRAGAPAAGAADIHGTHPHVVDVERDAAGIVPAAVTRKGAPRPTPVEARRCSSGPARRASSPARASCCAAPCRGGRPAVRPPCRG